MKNRLWFIPAAVIAIVLLIVGSIYDLSIAKAVFSQNNVFGVLISSLAEYPMYGGIALLGTIIIFAGFKLFPSKLFKGLSIAVGILAICGATYFYGHSFCGSNGWGVYNQTIRKLWAYLLIGFAFMIPMIILGFFLAKKVKSTNLIWTLFIMIVTCGVVILTNLGLKALMCRPRFRFLVAIDDFTQFRPWYKKFTTADYWIKQGYPKEEFKSFPSGHTMFSLMGAFICYIPYIIGKDKKYSIIFFYIGFAWTLLVAFSRMLVGAHFLSDVAFGMILSLIFIYIFNEIYIHVLSKKDGVELVKAESTAEAK